MSAVTTTRGLLGPTREWRLAGRSIAVAPPTLRDPRTQVSAVILSVHILGQVGLGFELSIAQILVTLFACAVIDVAVLLARHGALVWPGSGLLTGGGISLVLRVPGTEHGDLWSLHGWQWFVGAAAIGMGTKYVIRHRGSHVFNPSNVALVVVFVSAGSTRVEPLDFWWGPMGWAMVAAYMVIVLGGLRVGRRLDLTRMAVAFWLALAVGMGVLAVSGHSITARWSLIPVEGLHFWWIVVTSPEVLVFLFFMITDPRTVPAGRVARVAFASSVAVLSTLLMAPQTTEFGAKVGLLAGLVPVCMLRPWFDQHFPARGSADDQLLGALRRLFGGSTRSFQGRLGVAAAVMAGLIVFAAAVVAAGIPARQSGEPAAAVPLVRFEAVDIDLLPDITIDAKVSGFREGLETPEGARNLAVTLAGNLSVEGEAVLRGDPDLLLAVDHGDRLEEMTEVVLQSISSDRRTAARYTFDSLHLTVVFPEGAQAGANAGLVATGTVEKVTYGADNEILGSVVEDLDVTFTLRPVYSDRWLTTDVLED